MKDICTKTGDGGMTSLRGGVRVPKDDIRIETNGQIDHLNALLGVVRTKMPADSQHHGLLMAVQRELMVVMSHVATPDGQENPKPLRVAELTAMMEEALACGDAPARFVIPGASELSAVLHLARTQARTAERMLWTLNGIHPVKAEIMMFMNRLSDYLFLLALEHEPLHADLGK